MRLMPPTARGNLSVMRPYADSGMVPLSRAAFTSASGSNAYFGVVGEYKTLILVYV